MKLIQTNIISICEILDHYFPLEVIINELIEISGDPDLEDFPEIQESVYSHLPLKTDAINELSDYFYRNYDIFSSFIKKMVSEIYLSEYLESYQSSELLEKLNNILMSVEIRIENHKLQKKVQTFCNGFLDENLLFLDVDTPIHVVDYYKESLLCVNNKTFRSSILFSVFAFEAGLKYSYKHLEKQEPNLKLYKLIEWAIEKCIIENAKDVYDKLMELKDYRNKLVHCDPAELKDITSEIAEIRVVADLNLINESLNSIFN